MISLDALVRVAAAMRVRLRDLVWDILISLALPGASRPSHVWNGQAA